MANIMDLENRLDEVLEYKTKIREIESHITALKTALIRDMYELKVSKVTTECGSAEMVDYEIAKINNLLVNQALRMARENGTEFTAEDCKIKKRLNYLLVKKNRGE